LRGGKNWHPTQDGIRKALKRGSPRE